MSIQNYDLTGQMNYQSLFPSAVQPWQADLGSAIGTQYPALSGTGLSPGFQATPSLDFANNGNGFSNFLSNNGDLLKAGSGLLVGGFGAWNGYNQNKLMKQNLQQQASQFREQMDLSKQSINRNLEDRQAARVASNPKAYESVSEYMKKYGAK